VWKVLVGEIDSCADDASAMRAYGVGHMIHADGVDMFTVGCICHPFYKHLHSQDHHLWESCHCILSSTVYTNISHVLLK